MQEIYEILVETMSSTGALMTYLGISLLLIPVALFFVFYNGGDLVGNTDRGDPGGSDDQEKNSWLFWRKFIGYGILAVYGMAFLAVVMIISHHFFGLGVNAAVLIGLAIIGVVVLNPYWGAAVAEGSLGGIGCPNGLKPAHPK